MKGYIAISTTLVVVSIIATVTILVARTSINELQISLSDLKSDATLNLLESCVEDSLLRLNNENSLPVSFQLNGVTCNVVVEDNTGQDWTFTVHVNDSGYSKKIRINATRSDRIYVNSWEEINND